VLPNFLIGLREGLEAGLIIGILVAYLNRLSRRDVLARLWIGMGAAIAISLGVGALLTWGPVGLSDAGREALVGFLSIAAIGLVTWMIFWMGAHARGLRQDLHTQLDDAIAGAGFGIVVIGFVSVAREGIETALFIWASVTSGGNAVTGTIGATLGIATAVVITYLIYRGLVRINLSRFFTWTGAFLILVAAGVLADGVGALQQAGILAGSGQAAFSMVSLVPADSWQETLLSGLFSFTAEPTWAQVVTWVGYITIVGGLFIRQSRAAAPPRRVSADVPADVPASVGAPARPSA